MDEDKQFMRVLINVLYDMVYREMMEARRWRNAFLREMSRGLIRDASGRFIKRA